MPIPSLLRAFASRHKSVAGKTRVGVVGCGRMGQNHIRLLARHPRARLAGILDVDESLSQSIARHYGTRAFPSVEGLAAEVDAAVVATPTASHFAIGKILLEAGVSCLIEKPFTATLPEAEDLIRLAEERQKILQVGHIERFNSAVMEAARYIDHPRFIEVNRLGPFDPRVAGIGVVMVLMIHDLDIVMFLVGQDVARIEAFGAKVLSDHEDIAKVRLHFSGGCVADLSASRISLEKYRRIRIFQKDAYLSLDYAAPHLKIYRKKGSVVKSLSDIEIIKPKLSKQEPLARELDHFLACVRDVRAPLVSGRHGRDALELARRVISQLHIHG